MELIVYWTQIAEDKLDDIFNYYKLKASLNIAQNLVNGIVEMTIDLNKTPQIGQREILLEDRFQEFRYLIYKNYKIIYWINENKNRIEIINVFDCRQNPDRLADTE
ncbi:MAG: type II toxin-antitoxin system RelE/ParE family toxin [Lutibacter sp.]|nr:type II toxin-antitoxin system RelE/ParE family toxin [Lutibacter sp.]